MIAALLFFAAGTTDWPMLWAWLGVYFGIFGSVAVVVGWRNPDLIEERIHGERKADVKRWDRVIVMAVAVVLPPLSWMVAALDFRLGWSPRPAAAPALAALALVALANSLVAWAMATNRYFSAIVRIQKDRGHTVVSTGPYALIRHPGYVGAIVMHLATPVALGSRPALAVGALTAVLFVVRTALEDRTLHRELDGYAVYAGRVRWRLVPRIW